MQTIPDATLDKIRDARPHLAHLIDQLRATPARAAQLEKEIADNALNLEVTYLSMQEVDALAYCAKGEAYGGGPRRNPRGAGRPPTGAAKIMLQVRVEPELRERIRAEAEQEGTTETEIVTRALREYFKLTKINA